MATNGMNFQGSSYANETPISSCGSGDADFASDPASSGFFSNDYKKHQDLAQMLDSSKDNLKLEAMKRIIGLVAKGKDASDLFPAVVKNVVSKNIEVKKLVYVYLVRYAEEQQDLALLSISTFQRALKDPNQLIRASALRVLSSIRVPMIVPIMMLAIKEAVMDMSPYVRKTAAHAIPKLYSLDPEQREQLIELMEKLLGDKTTLVAGSAIQAFEEVCPERIDLIHRNYRKLCSLLVDVEEWGQVVIINMLTRYGRTQFLNPNAEEGVTENSQKTFYESSEDTEKEEEPEEVEVPCKKPYTMDVDHRLLLHTCKPLLNSRNAAVVMAVAQLYHHCAPKSEVALVAKALVRLLRCHKEVQYVVLSNIASMSIQRKGIFEPFLKSFYVRSNDPTHVKLLKLEILTTLATEGNISTILCEFQTYVTSSDKQFAAATIQAIGRCASTIAEVTDVCLNGLVSLLSNRDETVVGESVVVIKKLLQMQPSQHKEIITHLAKLVDTITVPMARASILWLIGEYSDRVPKIAPDVLRKMAKIFIDEDDIVKMQILNLAGKLCIINPKQTKILCQYVFNLAKYDLSYDIRDRNRLLRQLILPGEKPGMLSKHVKKIFFATKPAPVLLSRFSGQDEYQLGSLSHLINSRASEYRDLPEWPLSAPDPSVRNVEIKKAEGRVTTKVEKKKAAFYSESESSSEESSSEESESGSEESSSESESESEATESDSEELVDVKRTKPLVATGADGDGTSENEEEEEEEDESSSTEESSSEDTSEESDSEEDVKPAKTKKDKSTVSGKKTTVTKKKPSEMLLDLDFDAPVTGITSGVADLLVPMAATDAKDATTKVQPSYTSILSPNSSSRQSYDLLNRITGDGLGITYKFTRTVSIFSMKMVSLDLTFANSTDAPMKKIYMGEKKTQQGIDIHEFPEIPTLAANASTSALMAIDFNDTLQPAQFQVCFNASKRFMVSIAAPVGELLQPNMLSKNDFLALKGKLTGMNENTTSVELPADHTDQTIIDAIYRAANVLQIPSSQDGIYHYAGKTAAAGVDVLVTIKVTDQKAAITVNCERMVIGSMLVKAIKSSLLES